MAAMTSGQRAECWADWMRTETATVGITKADIRAAIDAADAWADSNSAEYNTALPQPARGTLTAAQKARLLAWVIMKRHTVGA